MIKMNKTSAHHIMIMLDPVAIGVERLRIVNGCSLIKEFSKLIRTNN